jgi:ribosome-associated protein
MLHRSRQREAGHNFRFAVIAEFSPPQCTISAMAIRLDPGSHSSGTGLPIAPGVSVPDAVLRWSFARSSGPGGQNVNKVETKAELRVWLDDLPLRPRVVLRLRSIAGEGPGGVVGASTRIDELTGKVVPVGGELVLSSQSHRSQSGNKDECLAKLRALIVQAQAEPKIRRKTKPTKGSIERRITEKKQRGETKRSRRSRDD